MFGSGKNKFSVDDVVYQKVKVAAGILGCSLDEFVAKALEQECDRVLSQGSNQSPSAADVDQIAEQLKGLGYLE